MVQSVQLLATDCRQEPAWKDVWQDRTGRSWYVEACEIRDAHVSTPANLSTRARELAREQTSAMPLCSLDRVTQWSGPTAPCETYACFDGISRWPIVRTLAARTIGANAVMLVRLVGIAAPTREQSWFSHRLNPLRLSVKHPGLARYIPVYANSQTNQPIRNHGVTISATASTAPKTSV